MFVRIFVGKKEGLSISKAGMEDVGWLARTRRPDQRKRQEFFKRGQSRHVRQRLDRVLDTDPFGYLHASL